MSEDTRLRKGIPVTSGLLLAALMLTPAMAQTEPENGPASAASESADAMSEGAEARFDRLDQDGDGYLTAEELLNEVEVAAVQEELDADADGRISRTEFAAMETGQEGSPQQATDQQATDDQAAAQQETDQRTAGRQDADQTDQQMKGQGAEALKELANQEDQLSQFVEALERTGMADALSDGEKYTLFAPTNEAFENYGRNLEDLSQDELVNVIRAHIVADDVDPEMAKRISEAKTIGGGTVQLTTEDDDTLKVGDAEVVTPNIQQANLRVYAINQVLEAGSPMTAGATETAGKPQPAESEGRMAATPTAGAADESAETGGQPARADGEVDATETAGTTGQTAGAGEERMRNLREDTVSLRELLAADVQNLRSPLGNVRDLILNEAGTAVEYVLYEIPYPYSFYGAEDGFVAFDNVSVEPLETGIGDYITFDDEAAAQAPEQLTLTRAEADHRRVTNLVGNRVAFGDGEVMREVEDILIDRETGELQGYVVNANPDAWFNQEPRVIPVDQVQVTEQGNVTTQAEFAALETLE